jgi:hypothetical protein
MVFSMCSAHFHAIGVSFMLSMAGSVNSLCEGLVKYQNIEIAKILKNKITIIRALLLAKSSALF